METFDNFNNNTFTVSTDVSYVLGSISGTYFTTTHFTTPYLTCSNVEIIPETDWMPYDFFEYDPKWHKKFAAIKYQMDKMWD